MALRVAIVAGEASGDQLGAGLIRALRERVPEAEFVGVAGSQMNEAGCHAVYSIEQLSVMGVLEVVKHLPALIRIRRALVRRWLQNPPDVFIGIDAPDFNLGLERQLHRAGIPTVHYVSPQVWAWRRYRLRRIAQSTDLMLTLLPFETELYGEQRVPVRFVGHPLADTIPLAVDHKAARQRLGLADDSPVVALLPGSRQTEVGILAEPFIAAARQCRQQYPQLQFIAPMASAACRALFQDTLQRYAPELPIRVVEGRAREALTAADCALVASGTATLEAMLVKCPMVVAYRVRPLTYWLAKRLVKTPFVALPNLLAQRALVPELIQEAATPERLSEALMQYLDHSEWTAGIRQTFTDLHRHLGQNADRQAAEAVLALLQGSQGEAKTP